jgi:formylglycine-generating enzyme required for sulfatase activity
VYSVGIVFFEILTTRHPVSAVVKDAYHIKDWEEAHCDRPLPSVAAFRPEVSPPIVQLVRRMLDKEAQFRPTWDEVRMALALEHQRTHGHDVEMSASQVLATEIVVAPFETPTLNDVGAVVARVSDSVEGFRERVAGAPEFTIISVQGGKFEVGSPLDEPQREDQEEPQHVVSVSAFFIAQAPVTNGLWKAVASMPKVARDLDPDPSYRKADELPVVRVAWHDCVEFCARLRVTTGRAYRLPTEAEWEYACRAGTSTPFAFGPTISTEWVNYRGTDPYPNAPPTVASPGITASGSFGIANAFGIFDMHGNVQEWCADPFHPSYVGAPEDGCEWEAGDTSKAPVSRVRAPAPGKYFSSLHYVLRGGSFMNCARACRSAYRTGMPSMLLRNDKGEWIGFRLALTLTGG